MNRPVEMATHAPGFGQGIALSAVLFNTQALGAEDALARFGHILPPAERELIKSLSTHELDALSALSDRVGPTAVHRRKNNNNNNNNNPRRR